MAELQIRKINELGPIYEALQEVEKIFFLSTTKNFKTTADKKQFYCNWTDYYLDNYKQFIYLAFKDNKICGYLMGCDDSAKALSYFKEKISSYSIFADHFNDFPAHLHINFHPEYRGQGIGSDLVQEFCKDLCQIKIPGVHIVTSPESLNVSFYKKNGFIHEFKKPFTSTQLLFMGKKL